MSSRTYPSFRAESATTVRAIAVHGDVSSDAACRTIATTTMDAYGRIDALVNNAGVTRYVPAGDLDASSADDFNYIFSVNVIGSYQMIRAAAPHLKQAIGGSIVNVSSAAAISGSGSSLAYAASKGALNTTTVGLARSLAPNVRVNAVCPSFVDTSWAMSWHSEASYAAFKTQLQRGAPLQNMPGAEDIADAIVWLTSHTRNITGQCLLIDSGGRLGA